MKKLRELLLGKPAQGLPVASIKTSVHSVYPKDPVPTTMMHIVLQEAIEDVYNRLKEH